MKYGSRQVIDLVIFDKDGKEIVNLDTLKEAEICFDYRKRLGYIAVKDVLLDSDILSFIHKEEDS